MKYLFSLLTSLLLLQGTLSAQTWKNLVPKPHHTQAQEGQFVLQKGFNTYLGAEQYAGQMDWLHEEALKKLFVFQVNEPKMILTKQDLNQKGIFLLHDAQLQPESYRIEITPDQVVLTAGDQAGMFYAVQTFIQMLPAAIYGDKNLQLREYGLDCVLIEDQPYYGYRGLMLDVSRTFYTAAQVKEIINWMVAHKLNRLHWHLTDDNGWRIEIKKYPQLTAKGAWRGVGEVTPPAYHQGNERYGGYYTQREIKDIVRYAAERHIEIIPEIDLPGHSRSLIGSMPQMACESDKAYISINGETNNVVCVGNEANYKILDNIIKEVAGLFPSQYLHIGGDEVDLTSWNNCPHCQELMKEKQLENSRLLLNEFASRMEGILKKYGKTMAGWEEITEGDDHRPETIFTAWHGKKEVEKCLERGYKAVMQMCEYNYFDMKYTTAERGHNWAAIIPLDKVYSFDPAAMFPEQMEKGQIMGVQAGMWGELLGYPARFIEYQLFPRTCALAEVGWTAPQLKDYQEFEERLYQSHFSRMYHMGIAFRVAPPQVRYEDGLLEVKAPHPSAVVRYTSNGSAPVASSPLYRATIATESPENYRFATFFGDELSSISVGASNIELYHYLQPATTIETNIPFKKPQELQQTLTCYDYNKVARTDRAIQAGDYLTYRFDEPVDCGRITVETGRPNITFYGVTYGYVEYSTDGTNYTKAGEFEYNTVSFLPQGPVKSVRIVITDVNDWYLAEFQNLKIECK